MLQAHDFIKWLCFSGYKNMIVKKKKWSKNGLGVSVRQAFS